MKRHDPQVRSRPRLGALLAASLLCAAVIACGPTAPGTSDATTESTGLTAGMTATSDPAVTDPGGTTVDVTTSTASTTPTTTTANPTCSFACDDDMPTTDVCDVFLQDCPEGQKCAAVITDGGGAWNDARCVPVIGTDLPGEPCTAESVADGLDSCVEGAMCWAVDMDGNGACVALCMGSPDAPICPNNGFCTISGDGFLNLCLPTCDPLLQDCPKPNDACYPINDGFTCAPDASGDTGKANDPCEFINVCQSGLLCAGPEFVGAGCPPDSMGCCTPFCKFPGGACPNPDQQCVQWFDPMNIPANPMNAESIGFCGVMP